MGGGPLFTCFCQTSLLSRPKYKLLANCNFFSDPTSLSLFLTLQIRIYSCSIMAQATAQLTCMSKPQKSALALTHVDAPNNFPTAHRPPLAGDNVTIVEQTSDTAPNVVGLALHDPQDLFLGWIRAGDAANLRVSKGPKATRHFCNCTY